jgi:GDP-L-fucose synthase
MGRRKIFVAGHRGMVGSAIVRRLRATGEDPVVVDRSRLDLRDQLAIETWLAQSRPDVVILAAARVGGIHANAFNPVDFLIDNLLIQTNVIRGSHLAGVDRLIFLGSSCIYPKLAPQPIIEESLLTGPLEPTNEWYAIAKISGIKMCQAYRLQFERRYIAIMPCNLYGPNDNFELESGHVLPALIRRFHEAKRDGSEEVVVWGTGTPLREFMHVDDLAHAVVFCIDQFDGYEPINCGTGTEISIRNLAELVREVVGFAGRIVFDPARPDGTPRKLMNSDRLRALGWAPIIELREGIVETYNWFLEREQELRRTG